MKPDIAAPGLNILAAWSPAADEMKYNILSGTSMSCPHVTGLVALIKAVYPHWTPSAIKSAILTTGFALSPLFVYLSFYLTQIMNILPIFSEFKHDALTLI